MFLVCLLRAEASCSHIVEVAQAEVESNPQAGSVMQEFAAIRLRDAEEGCHKLFQKHGFCVPVEVERATLGPGPNLRDFPFIRISTWARYLLDTGRLSRQLCGIKSFEQMGPTLLEFWQRYRTLHPTHELFGWSDAGLVDLSKAIPFFSHTDEGRTYKKQALLVISVHGAIGRGTRAYLGKKKHLVPLRRRGMGLNYAGLPLASQFIFASMHRNLSNSHPGSLEALLAIFASDCAGLARHGVTSSDGTQHVWLVHLATKGDLPALVKLGSFWRSYSHAPKAKSSVKPCDGICHFCLAGQESGNIPDRQDYPFEDFSQNPAWLSTVEQVLPWEDTPAILEGLPLERSCLTSFFATDLFHNFHLGVAKHWVASSLVSIVERLDAIPGTSVDAQMSWLSADFRSFCRRKRLSAHSYDISRNSLSFTSSRACPQGHWSKGSMSTQLMLYLEDLCDRCVINKTQDELLLAVASWQSVGMLYRLQAGPVCFHPLMVDWGLLCFVW